MTITLILLVFYILSVYIDWHFFSITEDARMEIAIARLEKEFERRDKIVEEIERDYLNYHSRVQ
jgi:uncharacterized protein (UPF0297 family)